MREKIVFYDVNGQEQFEPNYTSVAKEHHYDNESFYFIKLYTYGPQRGTPVNPVGMGFSTRSLQKEMSTGQSMAEFKKTTKENFDKYLKFLQTKNELFHRQLIGNV